MHAGPLTLNYVASPRFFVFDIVVNNGLRSGTGGKASGTLPSVGPQIYLSFGSSV